MMNKGSFDKYKVIDEMLKSHYCYIHADTSFEGLDIPAYLKKHPSVTLQISREFRGPLEISSEAIIADLLFDGSYYTCRIPLDAIWGATSMEGENVIWPESTTPAILKELLKGPNEKASASIFAAGKKEKKAGQKKKPHLKRVK